MDSHLIKIITDKGTYLHKFDDDEITLAETRKLLAEESWMNSDYRFFYDGEAEISLDDEANLHLAEVIQGEEIYLKSGKDTETKKDSERRHEPISVNFDTIDLYQDLSNDERDDLYRLLELQKGLVFNDNGAERAEEVGFRWTAEPVGIVQDPTLISNVTESTTKLVHQVKTSGVTKANANAGGWGVSVSTEATHSESSLHRRETTDVYYLAYYDIPKVHLTVKIENIELVEKNGKSPFVNEVANAMEEGDGDTFAQYAGLLKVFNQYGYYVPLKMNLGGRIFSEREEHDVSTEDIQTRADSFKVDFEANLESFGYPVQGGGGYSEEHSKETSDEMTKRALNVSKQARGGLPGRVDTPSDWSDSLNNYRLWRVIDYDDLHPTVMFLPDDLQNHVIGVLREHSPSPDTQRLTKLDMNSYVYQLGPAKISPW